ncbi:MAG: hypothetical protein ACTSO6_08215 [Promethearchaeota archaeon]
MCNLNQSELPMQFSIEDEHWMNFQLMLDVKDIKFDYLSSDILALHVREIGKAGYDTLVHIVSYQNSTKTFTTDASHVYFSRSLSSGGTSFSIEKDLDPPVENQWYPVSVSLDDGNISFSWDDEIVIEYYDDDYLTEGLIRISTDYGTCLDNIRIVAIGNSEQ